MTIEEKEFEKIAQLVSNRVFELARDLSESEVCNMDTLDAIRLIQEISMTAALFLERLYSDMERMISDGR